METIVVYYRYGQKYTQHFTAEQAREELVKYGMPGAKDFTDLEAIQNIQFIFND